ncbi:type I pullulanase [Mesobacillus foraminis]|uniref:pullulanase n=1 Tax=Mesobacillus foraminis TaxID=279826 RepID=A0A4R2BF48_9BACI|nr:type I pullulanase [Mesobacillus foraminis]
MRRLFSSILAFALLFPASAAPYGLAANTQTASYQKVVLRGNAAGLDWSSDNNPLQFAEEEGVWKSAPVHLQGGKEVEYKFVMDGNWLEGENLRFTPPQTGAYIFIFHPGDQRKVNVQIDLSQFTGSLKLEVTLPEETPEWAIPTIGSTLNDFNYAVTALRKTGDMKWEIELAGNSGEEIEYLYALGDGQYQESAQAKRKAAFKEGGMVYSDIVADWKAVPVAKSVTHNFTISPEIPSSKDDVTASVTVKHYGSVSKGAIYYTTDGSRPEGARGEAGNGQVAHMVKESEHVENGVTITIFNGVIPKQADRTRVKYIADVWEESGTSSQFADTNSPHHEGATEFAYYSDEFKSPDWAKKAVIYHVFVDRFLNGDPANDEPGSTELEYDERLKGWMGGDLQGVLEKLDYLKDLGVNTIWLSPIFEGPYSHGYHPADFKAVEDHFGSKELIKEVIDTAHAKGLKVVYDFVPNHTSVRHPFFQDALTNGESSPYYDWYTFTEWPDKYETFQGISELPQFNNDHAEARNYMLNEVVPYWLMDLDFDGFRLDYAKGPSYSFWVDFRHKVKQLKPEAFIFGEVWDSREKIDTYEGELDGALDFGLRDAIVNAFAKNQSMKPLEETIRKNLATYSKEYVTASFLDSHDQPRFLFEAGGDKDMLKLAAAAQFTLPGAPVVYYGDEVGLSQSRDHNSVSDWKDRYFREMMPWEAEKQDLEVKEFYKKIIKLRTSKTALSTGAFQALSAQQDLLAYERSDESGRFLIVINKGEKAVKVDVNALYNQPKITDVTLANALDNEVIKNNEHGDLEFTANARSFSIFEITGSLVYSDKPIDSGKMYDKVVLRGSQPLSWDGDDAPLTYNTDEKLWESQPIELQAGKEIQFKYVMDGNWLEGENLTFTPQSTENYVFAFDAHGQRKINVTPARKKITTKVKIHYQPKNGDTKDWNLWVWPDGRDGQVFDFTGEDAFGKVAEVELDGDHDRVGFIIRTDSWEKDGGDRFIQGIWLGSDEVWIKSGDDQVYTSNPDGSTSPKTYDSLEVKFNYYRYDQIYDNWDIWVWTDKTDGQALKLDKETAFGRRGTIKLEKLNGATKVGFIVRKSDWSEKDVAEDRFITRFSGEGKAEIWLAQDQQRIFDQPEKVDRTPRITKAVIDELNKITLHTNLPFLLSDGVNAGIQLDGAEIAKVEGHSTDSGNLVNRVIITTKGELDLSKTYRVSKEGFGMATVQMGKVIGSKSFEEKFYYPGNDLGNTYAKAKTKFRVWAPTASEAKLVTYEKYNSLSGTEFPMTRSEKGTWTAELQGDQNGTLYTYRVKIGDDWNEAVDPYARAVAVNGDKGAVVNLEATDPKKWKKNRPKMENPEDAIIYEAHIRDLTIHPDSGIPEKYKGKFLGVAETGTAGPNKVKTGLSHVKDLGITHLQFIPMYDYNTASVDETKLDTPQYNWGYDPKNYNVPEGSYSTDPYTPAVRIREMKQMIQTIHENDIRVMMDVVYNHMFSAFESNFHKLVPGYYYRYNDDGTLSNGTGVGNDTASEHKMMRKFIIDSVTYWAREYHIDGFRFDLMGIHDVETMNEVRKALDKIDPSIIVIGEGWDLGTNLPPELKANQKNAYKMPGIGHFNDDIRDGLKGSVFDEQDNGFVNGKDSMELRIKKGVAGGISYTQEIKTFAEDPEQTVTYVEAHDNHTLWDKLQLTNPNDSEQTWKKMHKLATSVVLTSQGISFIHAGQEFMRTKGGDHNSYKSPDSINQLDWNRRSDFDKEVEYFKGLVALRKSSPAFRMTTEEDIRNHLEFLQTPANTVAFVLENPVKRKGTQRYVVAYNANRSTVEIELPAKGNWKVLVNGERAGTRTLGTIRGEKMKVPPLSTYVLELTGAK